jgi:hypothetical protein
MVGLRSVITRPYLWPLGVVLAVMPSSTIGPRTRFMLVTRLPLTLRPSTARFAERSVVERRARVDPVAIPP